VIAKASQQSLLTVRKKQPMGCEAQLAAHKQYRLLT